MEKKILDVTCGSRTIWFDKNHPAAIYCDKRDEENVEFWKSMDGNSVFLTREDAEKAIQCRERKTT